MTVIDLSTRRFAWSWSRLKNWRTCPKRHWHLDLAKDIKEPKSEQLAWGDNFHDAMHKHIDKGTTLPKTMARYLRWPELIRQHKLAGAKVSSELKLAVDNQFRPVEWFDGHAWLRGVVDVLYLAPWLKEAAAIDWKTGGKIEPEFEQLGLTSQLVFAHHDNIDAVHTAYQWAAHDTETIKTYRREEMFKFWAKLMPEVNRMEQAQRNTDFPAKPSGLCIRFCPVTSCPYHGKGNR